MDDSADGLSPPLPPGWQVVQVHPSAPSKPPWGLRCNGCGICCLSEPCPLGALVSRRRNGACDALRWDEGASRYTCGMVTDPVGVLGPRWRWLAPLLSRVVPPLARRWISAGIGCDAELETEVVEPPAEEP